MPEQFPSGHAVVLDERPFISLEVQHCVQQGDHGRPVSQGKGHEQVPCVPEEPQGRGKRRLAVENRRLHLYAEMSYSGTKARRWVACGPSNLQL